MPNNFLAWREATGPAVPISECSWLFSGIEVIHAPPPPDLWLVPQASNARRFSVDLRFYPRFVAIGAACREAPDFDRAAPEPQTQQR